MAEWININLPWEIVSGADFYKKLEEVQRPLYRDVLQEKCFKKFGRYYEQKPYNKYYDLSSHISAAKQFVADNGKDLNTEDALAIVIKKFTGVDEAFVELAKFELFLIEYEKWAVEQPEYITWKNYFKSETERLLLEEKEKNKSFCSLGLNNAGTVIEVEYNNVITQLLIGDLNVFGSVSDNDEIGSWVEDCIVRRYKVIWEEGQE